MIRLGATIVALSVLTACSDARRPDIPVGETFPPVGLASTATWLERREVTLPQARAASDIPTSEIRSVVSGGTSPAASSQPVRVASAPRAQVRAASDDEVLESLLVSFRAGCLNNAPDFDTETARAAFRDTPPTLARGMFFISTGQPGRECNVAVNNYGNDRPGLTRSDVVLLTQELQQRLGGDVVVSNRRPDEATARLRTGRTTYRISSSVSRGRFSLTISK